MDEPAATDAELVARAQGGEIEAFGLLYQRYLDPIFRYIQIRMGDEQDAEDLSETVFLRAFESLDRYREAGHPFSAYLYRVARNLLADHYRQRSREAPVEEAMEIPSPDAGPDEVAEWRDRLHEISRALERLRPEYQEVIRLRVILALPTSTVGEWMGKSPGTVRVLLHRALKALREQMIDGESKRAG